MCWRPSSSASSPIWPTTTETDGPGARRGSGGPLCIRRMKKPSPLRGEGGPEGRMRGRWLEKQPVLSTDAPSSVWPSAIHLPPSRGKVSGARVTAPAKENVPFTVILRPQAEESVPFILAGGRETRGRGKRILRFAQDDTGVGSGGHSSSSLRTAMASKQSPLPLVSAWRRKPGPLPCFSFSRRTRCAGLRREAACGGKLFTPRPA